jgi:hypothetical protein
MGTIMTTHLDIEKERPKFEAAAKTITYATDRDIEREGDGYADYVIDTYWRFWLAGRRASLQADEGKDAHLQALEAALNPLRWTLEMNAAWHRAIPNVRKAFADLRRAAIAAKEGQHG